MKPKWLDRDLVRGPYITLCISQDEFKSELKRLKVSQTIDHLPNSHSNAAVHFLENNSKEFCCIVCVGDMSYLDSIEICGILVHESVHIFEKFCERIGESNPSSEFMAYSIQSISQRLIREYSRRIV